MTRREVTMIRDGVEALIDGVKFEGRCTIRVVVDSPIHAGLLAQGWTEEVES